MNDMDFVMYNFVSDTNLMIYKKYTPDVTSSGHVVGSCSSRLFGGP